ncbi:MAG: 2-amino-4-hydroxy-6-hydroxymethyldihydropteridine diphosphokinase [Nitrospirota bacterium]
MTTAIRAYIGIGSNVGDRFAHCLAAVEALNRLGGTRVMACSRWYETEPVGEVAQDWFLNGAVGVDTALSPHELLARCRDIEGTRGRDRAREIPRGPRPLDLDILLFGDQVITTPDLRVPHPRMTERAFVLVPLDDIAPRAMHPAFTRTIGELRAALVDTHQIRLYEAVPRSA